jgi:predicted NBD/HSP70 family sugar kinase
MWPSAPSIATEEVRSVPGPGDVLELIRRERVSTRGDLLEVTGLSRMTVAQRVDALLAAGLVVEGPGAASTGGRRPRRLRFNVDHALVLAATVDTTHTRVALTDLSGRIVVDHHLDVAVADGPASTLDGIGACGRRLVEEGHLGDRSLCGIGISVPGPVDPGSGRPSQPPIMPGWDAYPLGDHLRQYLPAVPVVPSNDADAAALGEHTVGFPGASALCLVKVSTGIGTGIVIDGRVYRGTDGGAGDIGHVRLHHDAEDAVCQCGAVGCLAAVASGRAVARRLASLGVPAVSGRDVGALLSAGNGDAARLTQDAGRLIGEVMATVVCVLNPEVLVVHGDLASAPLLAGLRETLYRLSLPRATRHLTLQLGVLGDRAPLVGLTRMVVDRHFSAEAVNQRLG